MELRDLRGIWRRLFVGEKIGEDIDFFFCVSHKYLFHNILSMIYLWIFFLFTFIYVLFSYYCHFFSWGQLLSNFYRLASPLISNYHKSMTYHRQFIKNIPTCGQGIDIVSRTNYDFSLFLTRNFQQNFRMSVFVKE